jgi:GT2 family glycosyltransferase
VDDCRENNSKLSIIVVNWNGERFLKGCLGALSGQSYGNREIILVDNGSSDNSVRFVRENFPEVKVIALGENTGFTGGTAAGLEVAQGTYIALVNNDARPDEGWLENLIQPMLRDPTIGICTSKLIFENPRILNSVGDGLTTAELGFNRGLGHDTAAFDAPAPVFGACGAAVLYRRRMLDEIDFLDEDGAGSLQPPNMPISLPTDIISLCCQACPFLMVAEEAEARGRCLP